ncbi:MutS-like protein, partial [Coelomomyces lativittatus]
MADKPELILDSNAQLGFLTFYRSLPEKPPSLIRLFERNSGDYYSAHGEDAIFIAREFYKTTSILKPLGVGATSLPSCTLSRSNFETFISDALQNKGLKIEIWAQTEPRKSNQWKCVKE